MAKRMGDIKTRFVITDNDAQRIQQRKKLGTTRVKGFERTQFEQDPACTFLRKCEDTANAFAVHCEKWGLRNGQKAKLDKLIKFLQDLKSTY